MKEYDKSKLYLMACSGGPDSMALLNMLLNEKYNLIVCHVNYKTREESDSEEQLVIKYCKKHNLKLYIEYFDNNYSGSFEDAARKFRYSFFANVYEKEKASGLFVAHHKDDLLETYLLKKQRNVVNESYLIKEKVIINKMNVLRPMLYDFTKDDLLAYCKENNIEYGIDKTNFMDIHPRNVIRKQIALMDKEKLLNEALLEEKHLNNVRKEVKEFIKFYPIYNKKMLEDKTDLWLRIFLYEAIDTRYRKYINKALFLSLKNFIKSEKSNLLYCIYGKYHMTMSYGIITFENIDDEEYAYTLNEIKLMKTKQFVIKSSGLKMEGIYLKDDDFPIIIRNYKEDDKIALKQGNKKVSRLFIDKKIPLYKRCLYPVIENNKGEIIFVYKLYRKYGYKNVTNNVYLALKS